MKLALKTKRSPFVSLTPLIDVVFILLIFFMLVSQFSQWQQQPLPLDKASYGIKDNKAFYTLRLRELGQLTFNQQPISWPLLAKEIQINAIATITLDCDASVSIQQFIIAKEKLTALGIITIHSRFNHD